MGAEKLRSAPERRRREKAPSDRARKIASALGAVDQEKNLPEFLAEWEIVAHVFSDLLLENPERNRHILNTNYRIITANFCVRITQLGQTGAFNLAPELKPMFALVAAQPSSQGNEWGQLVKKVFRLEPIPEFAEEVRKKVNEKPQWSWRKQEAINKGQDEPTYSPEEIEEWEERVKNSHFGLKGEILLIKGWFELGEIDRLNVFPGMVNATERVVYEWKKLVERSGIDLEKLESEKAEIIEETEKKLREAIVSGVDLDSLPVCSDLMRYKVLDSFPRFPKGKALALCGRIKSQVLRNSLKTLAPCLSC